MAEIIKEDLWPNPLKYFNNVIDSHRIHYKTHTHTLTIFSFVLKGAGNGDFNILVPFFTSILSKCGL